MRKIIMTAALAALAGPAVAQDACTVEGDPYDLTDAAVVALYDCMSARMLDGYTGGDDPRAAEYRDWTVTATRAAAPGPHGERFLLTFANEIAAEQYLEYEEGDFEMPVGSVLAKESFAVRDGTAKVGPLFFMTKSADAPETDGWVYSALQPNGNAMGISQDFCHSCHSAFEAQDSMGYPAPEVRLDG